MKPSLRNVTTVDAARATVVLVGGHEGGGHVALEPLPEQGPLLRASSARQHLQVAVQQALDNTDLPVCVVPMTLGRDPRLVADSARTLLGLSGSVEPGRIVLADPFGSATLLTGWLRVAVAGAAAGQPSATDHAVILTAKAANPFDDAELFRIAHLVKVQESVPWVEVALHGGDPNPAEVVARCRKLGARQITTIPADFEPPTNTPLPGVTDHGPLLSPATISGMLATRIAGALLKLTRDDDGITTSLDADHHQGHGGGAWREPDPDAG